MSESIQSTLISALPAATKVSDTDIVVLENGSTTQKITIAQLKEALGINALNTKSDLKGTYQANVHFNVTGNYVGCPFIPIPNANLYNIEITDITVFGGADKASFAWTIAKSKLGINIQIGNSDAAYYFGTAYPNRLWTLTIKIS